MTDPIKSWYDQWKHHEPKAGGDIMTAVEAHLNAMYWIADQLETGIESEGQPKAIAHRQFRRALRSTHQQTEGRESLLDSFVIEVLEAFGLKVPVRLWEDIPD